MSAGPPCDGVRGLAAEIALGAVSGAERAAVLEHLAGCDDCRDAVADLARIADRLLLVAPQAEPPPGFESRVLDRLAAAAGAPAGARPAPPRRRWVAALVAAVALVLAGTAAGWVAAGPAGTGGGLVAAPMQNPEGDDVGRVFLFDGERPWVFLAMDGWSSDGYWGDVAYRLRVDLVDGRTVHLDGMTFGGGDGGWGSVLGVDPDDVRWVGVVDDGGRVYCGARLREA